MSKIYRVQLTTLLRKEITRVLRIWSQTLIPPIITTALYFLIFGTVIGNRIGPLKDQPYAVYIFPGLILMSIITASYSNVSSSFFSAKFHRFIEEMLISSMRTSTILIGFLAGGLIRALLVCVLIYLVCVAFLGVHLAHPGLALAIILISSTTFASAGLINGIFANSFDDVSFFPTFLLTPLIYLGGVFYPISLLPDFWYTVSLINPIVYFVDAARFAFLGQSELPILYSIIVISTFCALLVSFAFFQLKEKYITD